MKKQPRWMTSAIAASTEPQVALPWARGQRRRPAALTVATLTVGALKPTPAKPRAQAAH